ncbi:hypothetical protein JW756_07125 [Candidatus Woesearchaeota archaeon]|nr:hypothetical protein [Candidatus Woesearchaeota archaeon]
MVKKEIFVWLVIIIVIASVLLIAGCSKAECKKNSDCTAVNKCFTARCGDDGKCSQTPKSDCCGNAKCEEDSGETKCTCSQDCGKCSGHVKYTVTTTRGSKSVNATYAVYKCEDTTCLVGVDDDQINELKLTNNVDERSGFKAEVLTTLNNPFDTRTATASVRVLLTDINLNVMGAITFTRIQILEGSELLGENIISQSLGSVGESFTEELSLTSSQSLVEESKTLDVKVDYEYIYNDGRGDVIKRNYAKNRLTEKVIFVVQ